MSALNGKGILEKELWYQVGEDLGEVSDLRIEKVGGDDPGYRLLYKSNGLEQTGYFEENPAKRLIHCLLYCINEFSLKPVTGKPKG